MEKYKKLIDNISKTASIVFNDNEGEVYLFGSQARKDFTDVSDWDLLILIENTLGKEEDFNKYGFPFCEMGWSLDADINPLVYSKKEWEEQKHSYFFYNVRRDAIKLYS